jgi:hypothetical protein
MGLMQDDEDADTEAHEQEREQEQDGVDEHDAAVAMDVA